MLLRDYASRKLDLDLLKLDYGDSLIERLIAEHTHILKFLAATYT